MSSSMICITNPSGPPSSISNTCFPMTLSRTVRPMPQTSASGPHLAALDSKRSGDMYMMVPSESCASSSTSPPAKGVHRPKSLSLHSPHSFINTLLGFTSRCTISRVSCKYANPLATHLAAHIAARGAKRIDPRDLTTSSNDPKCMSSSVIDTSFLTASYPNPKHRTSPSYVGALSVSSSSSAAVGSTPSAPRAVNEDHPSTSPFLSNRAFTDDDEMR
mmetsp:Transcript_5901/g.23312  ORF Transcript_5901/g.23312 Transcript_5901/m.23312 type:complete len:218 (+) Transcript_5901:2140-2793(+)